MTLKKEPPIDHGNPKLSCVHRRSGLAFTVADDILKKKGAAVLCGITNMGLIANQMALELIFKAKDAIKEKLAEKKSLTADDAFASLKDNLEKNGFSVSVFENAASAAKYLDSKIDGKTVGFGGSVTLRQMGLFEMLSSHNSVFWHWSSLPKEEAEAIRRNAALADIYISSVNAISETGELVNIDGNGNRVSAIQCGHEKVYLVAGINKLAPDFDTALFRARNIAAPLNAQRLGRNTPCAKKADRCYDCSSPERICRGVSVLLKKPTSCDYEVVLINEELGY